MTAAAPNGAAAATEPRRLIAAFASQASFETAYLAPGDLAALRAGFAAGTAVYVSAVASHPPAEQIDIHLAGCRRRFRAGAARRGAKLRERRRSR